LDENDLDELLMYDNFKEKNNAYINKQRNQYSKYWNITLLGYLTVFTFLISLKTCFWQWLYCYIVG